VLESDEPAVLPSAGPVAELEMLVSATVAWYGCFKPYSRFIFQEREPPGR
jgi:hypothetical protein